MTNPTPNSLCPQGEHAPGPEPLSPAAEAKKIAAIRALADQLRIEMPLGDTDADAGVFAAHQAIHSAILAIATELEGQQ